MGHMLFDRYQVLARPNFFFAHNAQDHGTSGARPRALLGTVNPFVELSPFP